MAYQSRIRKTTEIVLHNGVMHIESAVRHTAIALRPSLTYRELLTEPLFLEIT
jgi:hypothetical protein